MSEFNKGYYRRQGRIQGAVEERERIIKLIERRRDWLQDMVNRGQIPMIGPVQAYSNVIELIKGETNGN